MGDIREKCVKGCCYCLSDFVFSMSIFTTYTNSIRKSLFCSKYLLFCFSKNQKTLPSLSLLLLLQLSLLRFVLRIYSFSFLPCFPNNCCFTVFCFNARSSFYLFSILLAPSISEFSRSLLSVMHSLSALFSSKILLV